jgi:hypothetical protein
MIPKFDFDPQLPTLALVFDLDMVAGLFEEHWQKHIAPDRASITIKGRRPQYIKYQPGVSCLTTYELLVERPGAASWQTIGAVEVSPAGLTARPFYDDLLLPWLPSVIDPAKMRERFAALLAEVTGAEAVESCTIIPVRYKPGSRCMLRFELCTASSRQLFFGKLLAQDSQHLMTIITALHHQSQTTPAMPRFPRPLVYWPEVHLLIQEAVASRAELHTLAFDTAVDSSVRERWLRTAGGGLAVLHNSAGANGLQRLLKDDLTELRADSAPIAQVNMALAQRFEEAIGEISNLASDRAEPALVASHGALRTDQFMIEDGNLVLIDLDSFCWANPARDPGNFLAYLCWKAIRQPQHATFIERAGRAFLEGYLAVRPDIHGEWLALYQAASMLKIVGRRFRSLTYSEWPLIPRLLDAAFATLRKNGL